MNEIPNDNMYKTTRTLPRHIVNTEEGKPIKVSERRAVKSFLTLSLNGEEIVSSVVNLNRVASVRPSVDHNLS